MKQRGFGNHSIIVQRPIPFVGEECDAWAEYEYAADVVDGHVWESWLIGEVRRINRHRYKTIFFPEPIDPIGAFELTDDEKESAAVEYYEQKAEMSNLLF
jgi:hypothetical protein